MCSQAQQNAQPMVNNQMRGQNRRGRGRTNSSSSNSQRREFVPRANNQPEIPQSVIDPQAQMIAAAPPGQHYQYYVQYPYHYNPQGQAGVPHPNAPPTSAPVYLHHMPMYTPSMYGYQHMYPVMPHEYIVDEKVVDEQGAEAVQQMWSPNHEYQDPHQMEQQVPLPDEYVTQQMAPQQDEILIAEEINQQNAQNTIQIHHQPIQMHHPAVPHSVLNPNVPNFTVVNQPVVAVQNDQVPVPQPPQQQQQHYTATTVVPQQAQVQQDFAMPPQGNISPIAANVVAQSYSNVSQHLAIATSNENNEQTFIQAASAVTVVNTSSTYESIPGIKTVTQIEHEAVAGGVAGGDPNVIVEDFVNHTNENNAVKSNKVPLSVSVQQQQQQSR